MKDYNSIPFKNKAIDRLTKSTTIVPGTQYEGTQLKEVKVTPASISYDQSNNIQGYNKAPMRPIKLDQRDQSNDKLVDSRPYKETGAYKDLKAAKKSQIKSKIKNNMNNIGAGLTGAGFLGTFFGTQMKNDHSGKNSQNF
jgi:hypothetical protein